MLLSALPDDARVWLFVTSREISDDKASAALAQTRAFLNLWTSHGRPVPGEVHLLHARVFAVGAHLAESETNAGVSGCGIDSLVHAMDTIAANLGFAWTSALDVQYFDDNDVLQSISRAAFRRLGQIGAITPGSFVLDLTPTTVLALRHYGIRRPVEETWHRNLLQLTRTA